MDGVPVEAKSARELLEDERKRLSAMGAFMGVLVKEATQRNREQGGDGNVLGVVVE